ncbi:MAG: GGDEF domain-containing protein [Halopseudomonas sp.]|uniref:GGDEF domain-containing protein n=1 Tax=Halopseudomonas sp. TaxID=2901191 RepID=UPI003001826F
MGVLYFSPMLLGICLLLAIAVSATALRFMVPTEQGPGFWMAGCWSLIGGIGLFIGFILTHNPWLNVLGNAAQLAGEALFLLGIFRFMGRPLPWWTVPASAGVMALFNTHYWLYAGNSDFLMGVYSTIAGLLPAQAIWLLLSARQDSHTRPAQLLVAISLVIYSLATLLRGYLGYHGWWHDQPYTQPYQSFSYLLPYNFAIPALVMGFVGCTLMTTQRVLARSHRLAEQLQELATRDPLTGVLNRRAFHEHLQQELARAQRYGTPLCLAMLDLDHFKQLNDRLGHLGGDQALQRFAWVCEQQARSCDVFARIGGEEFVLLMPQTGTAEALRMLGRLQKALADERQHYQQQDYALAFSTGLAERSRDESADSLLKRADQALYAAKAAGRNRIEVWEAPLA